MKFPIINDLETNLFFDDLHSVVNLTPLNGVVFPVMVMPEFKSRTTEYSRGQVLEIPRVSNAFEGHTFSAVINTYFHEGGSSICLVENVMWRNQPGWFPKCVGDVVQDAADRNLTLRPSHCPIFLVVSARATKLWGTHRDGNLIRVHHVLTSSDCSIQFFKGETVVSETKFVANNSYEFDVSIPHNVVANDDQLRVNIVMDCNPR